MARLKSLAFAATGAAASFTNLDAATLDFDSAGLGYARLSASGATGATSRGVKLRSLNAGALVDALVIAANGAATFIGAAQFGGNILLAGATASFPMIKRLATSVHFKLADDSAFTAVAMDNIVFTGTAQSNGGTVSLGAVTRATVGATGAATVLPGLPLGYLDAYIGTAPVGIPYYNRGA